MIPDLEKLRKEAELYWAVWAAYRDIDECCVPDEESRDTTLTRLRALLRYVYVRACYMKAVRSPLVEA